MDALVCSAGGKDRKQAALPKKEVFLGLVFDQYETDAYHFMQTQKFTVGGMRHLLRGAVAGLGHLHESGLARLDFKPPNILLHGTGPFRGYFGRGRGG